ncbi:glycosyltransferase family 2 protein [Blastococcus atacamensis]|uniref:glycosyltransferase family 2 protein n=1 Tax=Blastococcus atacamensis TaxID=2070508 RepID=UPI000CEBE9C6|nr:glycosyltransferase family 2 protein [Blastococcus atacamensis]
MAAARVSIVIPTLGRRLTLTKRLLQSLSEQTLRPTEIVLVDQSDDHVCRDLGEGFDLPVRVIRSAPGVSRARNAGIRGLSLPWDIVGLPDDDCFYDSDALERAARRWPSEGGPIAISGIVRWPDAQSRIPFRTEAFRVTVRDVWRSTIEAGLFLSRDYVEKVGLFDVALGLGSSTRWGSGEGTDLLLRGMRTSSAEIWYDPAIVVWEDPSTSPVLDARRGRAYARGTGFVYARHYGFTDGLILIARSGARLLLALKSGSKKELHYHAAVLVGRLEGLLAWRAARGQPPIAHGGG